MSRLKKAKQGQRLAEARKAIRGFEARRLDWSYTDLAAAMAISTSQARNLVASLTLRGHLAPKKTQVAKVLPCLTDIGAQAS
jgi:hypothetical protein